ncbi:carboxylating nicotinate-nucleotide diphosphorylase [Leifsonia sp. NPDC058292]|uniref:carboxylating nicotinate-nucleotide diphosphorylase n=1 Tax=Leifsonia sp. NPDC058292 TaxID=3346428 RepID=UPI0036DDF88F
MLTDQTIETVVRAALLEDAPWGDLTSQLLIPETAYATARLNAREPGTFSGGAVFAAAMRLTDSAIDVELAIADGDRFEAGDTIATVTGPARSVLQAERVALNLVQRMSGIATLTASFAQAVAHTPARIVDTRKTTPGLRAFERHAVRSGGGHNHRFSLSDAVMAKDNHIAVLTAQSGLSVTDALLAVRAQLSHTTHLEVEVDRIDQIEPVLAARVDTIMLDNFTVEQLRDGVAIVGGRALVEASGNVNLSTVRDIAETGVDVISVGALTHSVRSLDLGLDVVVEANAVAPAVEAAAG